MASAIRGMQCRTHLPSCFSPSLLGPLLGNPQRWILRLAPRFRKVLPLQPLPSLPLYLSVSLPLPVPQIKMWPNFAQNLLFVAAWQSYKTTSQVPVLANRLNGFNGQIFKRPRAARKESKKPKYKCASLEIKWIKLKTYIFIYGICFSQVEKTFSNSMRMRDNVNTK